MAKQEDYENMSREDLMALIGTDIDPSTTHDELVMMAMERDKQM